MLCWAAGLGDCGGGQSREHLISAGVFGGDRIFVHGFPWCKGEPKEIGLPGLTAKVLCRRHNERLSLVDKCAQRSAIAVNAAADLMETRQRMGRRRWVNVKRFEIDGAMMERWCTKTMVNLLLGENKFCEPSLPIGSDSEVPGRPSERLVRAACGIEPLNHGAGLYLLVPDEVNLYSGRRVSFTPLRSENPKFVAGLFRFIDLIFMLWLDPGGPPDDLSGPVFQGEQLGHMTLLPRFPDPQLKVKIGEHLSHVLAVKW